MSLWWRYAWAWGSAAGAVLAVALFAGYVKLRSAVASGPPGTIEHFFVGVILVAAAVALTAYIIQRRLGQALHDLEELHQASLFDNEKQRRYLESLQREQHQAEVTLQSILGKADAEAGQSHSLIHRRSSDAIGTARDAIARLTPTLCWLAATPALQKFLGYTIIELNARSVLELVHPDDVIALRSALEKALRTGEGHDIRCRIIARGGQERHVQIDVLTRYVSEDKPLHMRCHFIDITERVQTDRELRHRTDQLSQANERLQRINTELERLKESYRDLYHNAPVLYFSLDARSHFAACNETMFRMLGYSREELIDQPYVRLLAPDSRERFRQRPDAYQRAGEIESQWVKKDGTVIDVWIRSAPVQDGAGRFLRSRSVAQDMTERNRLANALRAQAEEMQRTNERLQRINRELDDFTYVVSHDLKEPLRTLQAFSNFLAQDYRSQLGAEGQEYIDHLISASKRLGNLIDDLLTLSRIGRVLNTPRVFDLNETFGTVRSDLAGLIQRKNAIIRCDGPLPSVLGDPPRVAQLLANLVSNGLKYNESPRPEVLVGTLPPRNGVDLDRVIVYVRDNGIGIDPKYHDQVFGIFRRLHLPEQYEGTGAGLAICKKIVEAHGGRIWIESQPGAGATFFFTLPRPAAPSRSVVDETTAVQADDTKMRVTHLTNPRR
ncbi:MAG: PAS domain S-box protein [Gemmataceae bacterium]|nr:PAS domain S-box protein [Gemmataceae bacterium]